MSLRLSNTRIARSSHDGGGAFQPRPRLRPAALRQRPSHRADRSRGRATRPHARTARQGHAALGRIATSVRGRERQGDLPGGGRSHRRGHGSRGVRRAVMEELGAGRLAPDAAAQAIAAISRAPPVPAWLFTLAAAAGAVALALIFGVEHSVPAALIFVSAAAGAILRRGVARVSANVFLQPFCAALVAGVIGGLAVRYQLSSSLRLVAVCPCMVLVPGPHVLNGALDLINGRIHLGAARLTYAGLVIAAISTGLLLGLALLGVTLPVDEAGRIVPFWQDVIAAGVAVAAYSVFFSTPLNMLPWPVAVGMLSHALRWGAITVLGFGAAIGTLLACLIV